jgi:hypothetical protein
MIVEEATVEPGAFFARTGWEIKPQGACKDDVCVPLPDAARAHDGKLDVQVIAECLGMPYVADDANGVGALGPELAPSGRVLSSAKAPELVLPDAHGNPFRLSSLLGQKVLLVAWASW